MQNPIQAESYAYICMYQTIIILFSNANEQQWQR